jgi:transposase
MLPIGVEVFVAVEPVDMRLGIERLGAVVRERMRREPRSRALFVFVGKRRQSLKVLSWDGTGMVLWYKKLDRGLFELPRPSEAGERSVVVSEAMFEAAVRGAVHTGRGGALTTIRAPRHNRPAPLEKGDPCSAPRASKRRGDRAARA